MRWMDHAYLRLRPRLGCFENGFGDRDVIERPFDRRPQEEPAVPAIRWTAGRVQGPVRVLEGELESPDASLPAEVRVARVALLTPREGKAHGLAVSLAAWGDEGFDARRRWLAHAASEGVACLLLENAFYGARRRIGQRGACLLTVSDFVRMGRATVRESHALMAWGRAEGYAKVGVIGYSMGGQMAAMSAALAPWPVYTVAMAPAVTPASVFLDGPLRADVAWSALGDRGTSRLRAVLSSLSVLSLPKVAAPVLATLVGTRADAIVPPDDVMAIARHWEIAPRWLGDGHVSAIAFRGRALAQAVIDTFSR